MTPKIYALDDEDSWQSLWLTEAELQISPLKCRNPSQFLEARNNGKSLQVVVPLDKIERLIYTEDDYDVTIDFPDDPYKQGGVTVEFKDRGEAQEFIRSLSGHLNLRKSEEEEDLMSALYSTVPWFLGAIGLLIAALLIKEEDVMGRRGRKGAAIARLIYGILGETGVIAVAGIAVAATGYLLFSRVTNRKSVATYRR